MKKNLVLILALALSLSACKNKSSNLPDQTLLNTRWMLESIGEEKVTNVDENKPIDLLMEEGDENRVSGFGGCNRYFGAFILSGDNGLLFMKSFPKVENNRWVLTAIGEESIENTNKENPIHLMLTPEEDANRVSGMAGCNRIMGSYLLSDDSDSLTFSQMATTRMMCDRMDIESKYVAALNEVDSYEVEGVNLYLKSKGNRVLSFRIPNDDSSRIAPLAATLMACQNMETEGKYMAALATVDSYDIEGTTLYLISDGVRVLTLKAQIEE